MVSAILDTQAVSRLVVDARRGDRVAADRLIREHDRWVRSIVYAVCGRVDLVDDVTQQVWTQAWERLDSLRDPQRLRSWLYNIARNAAIDAGIARKRRSATVSLEVAWEPSDGGRNVNPARAAMDGEVYGDLVDAVQSLPALYREPFVLRHLEDWSYAQIGEVLSLSVEAVETRLIRARRMLRETLKGKVAP